MILRPYQRQALDRIESDRVCLVAPTGSGKTAMAAAWATETPGRTLWIAHRIELVRQAAAALSRLIDPLDVGVIAPGEANRPHARIQVATVQTLLARDTRPTADRVVLDECFPAGTMIGDKPIETILPGDIVPSFDETSGTLVPGRVVRIFRRPAPALVRVSIAAASITCTGNHPFLTTRGWVAAAELRHGDKLAVTPEVASYAGMQDVRRTHSATPSTASSTSDMLGPMSSGLGVDGHVKHQSPVCLGSHEAQQPDDARGDSGTHGAHPEGYWARPEGSRGQRPAAVNTSTDVGRRARMADGVRGQDICGVPTEPLQTRHRESPVDGRDRGGRSVSFLTDPTATGLPQGDVPVWVGLDRVEVLESGDSGLSGNGPFDGCVYNLEVAGTHTYVANGFVVHNCHHYSADDWRTVLDAYPGVKLLGLTATPERRDGKPLGDIFDQLVVAARYPDLVEAGHLTDCRAFIPPGELGTGALALDPLVAYERHTPGERAFLFAPSVAQAATYAERFTAAGHPARAITERTSKRDRAEWLEAFAAGELRVLANVYTLTEGVDIPAASVAILARRIVHVSMYLQIAGRILRPHPSKQRATLLDLTGATIEHGLPTEDRIYSLDGRPIRRCNESLRQCPQCGAVLEGSPTTCPECGYDFPARKAPPPPRIYSLELREVYAGKATPTEAKREEFVRLWRLARERGWSLGWVVKEYETLFGQPPLTFTAMMRGEFKREEFDRLTARAAERGYSSGWVAHAYRRTFGAWPPSGWRVVA